MGRGVGHVTETRCSPDVGPTGWESPAAPCTDPGTLGAQEERSHEDNVGTRAMTAPKASPSLPSCLLVPPFRAILPGRWGWSRGGASPREEGWRLKLCNNPLAPAVECSFTNSGRLYFTSCSLAPSPILCFET